MRSCCAAVALALAASAAHAESLEGRAEPDSTIRVTSAARGDSVTTLADRDGRYRIGMLVPGTYVVEYVDLDGRLATRQVVLGSDLRDLSNLPLPGRTFEDALGTAPQTTNDGVGVAFAGSTSLENRYVLDGADVNDLVLGGMGTTVPLDFLQTMAITSGGWNASVGRTTGGLAVATTRAGTSDFHGSAFATLSPSWLRAAPRATSVTPATISVTPERAYDADVGVTLGGPIVRDRLWFFAGFAPQLLRTDYTRTIRTQTDCRINGTGLCEPQFADTVPDRDPKTGLLITQVVDRSVRSAPTRAYPALLRLDTTQGFMSALLVPSTTESPELIGLAASGRHTTDLTSDVAAHWGARIGTVELEATLGWHRDHQRVDALDPSRQNERAHDVIDGKWSDIAGLHGESGAANAACTDGGPGDPFPMIENCPLRAVPYEFGGPGTLSDDLQDRRSAIVTVRDRIGSHLVEVGLDVQYKQRSHLAWFSGAGMVQSSGPLEYVDDWVRLSPNGSQTCATPNPAGGTSLVFHCDPVTADTPPSYQETKNRAVFARDTWHPLPNLEVEAGARLEHQRVMYASDVQNTTDPLTGRFRGETALDLHNDVAPRFGIAYQLDQANLFAHWGRYFETVPMEINERSFAQEVLYETIGNGGTDLRSQLIGISGVLVDPGARAPYVDELVTGAHLAPTPSDDLRVTYQHRAYERGLEDVSLDSANTYIIANPGEGVATGFDRPRRDYDALTFEALHRFGATYAHASYTYSRTSGNYPGLISYDNGQADPNISSQFDLVELLANRTGPLPQDRTHIFKLDASHVFGCGLVLGLRERWLSGAPESALGGHYLYGENESFVLPRGIMGRTPSIAETDLHIGFGRWLSPQIHAEVFADVFNVFDQRGAVAVDQTYAPYYALSGGQQNANPIVGGNLDDLVWLKTIDASGHETNMPISRNPHFLQPTAYAAPTSARLGARLTF